MDLSNWLIETRALIRSFRLIFCIFRKYCLFPRPTATFDFAVLCGGSLENRWSLSYNSCCLSLSARVEDANWTLRKIIRTNTHKVTSKTPGVANAEPVNGLQNSTTKSRDENISDSPHLQEKDLQKIVSFEKGNFVLNWHPPANKTYHAILW